MTERIVSFVMSGGVGSRLWPLSREDNPKQFHDFSGDGSMLVKTLRRLKARKEGETPVYLIASERHADRVRSDMAGIDLTGGGAIFEPCGRNTAAAVAIANGLNRATGLAYGAVSRQGLPLDRLLRSWPQSEAIKAAIALNGAGSGPDLKPEIEARIGRLFRWHIDPAPLGLWIDQIDERGRSQARDVPASIFHHLVCALTQYLDATEGQIAVRSCFDEHSRAYQELAGELYA
jgi:hypothetical protein